ncbi:hypothetical protein SDJN03_05648, partial [Cucurbita argyrosperma subsp. sororia]
MPGQRTKGKRIGSHQDDEMSRTRHWLAGNVKAKMGQPVTRLDASHSHIDAAKALTDRRFSLYLDTELHFFQLDLTSSSRVPYVRGNYCQACSVR